MCPGAARAVICTDGRCKPVSELAVMSSVMLWSIKCSMMIIVTVLYSRLQRLQESRTKNSTHFCRLCYTQEHNSHHAEIQWWSKLTPFLDGVDFECEYMKVTSLNTSVQESQAHFSTETSVTLSVEKWNKRKEPLWYKNDREIFTLQGGLYETPFRHRCVFCHALPALQCLRR